MDTVVVSRAGSKYYLPQAPFLFGMVLLAGALVLAISVCRLVDQSSSSSETLDSAPADVESSRPEKSRASIEHEGLAGVLHTIKPQRSMISRLSLEEAFPLRTPLLSNQHAGAESS